MAINRTIKHWINGGIKWLARRFAMLIYYSSKVHTQWFQMERDRGGRWSFCSPSSNFICYLLILYRKGICWWGWKITLPCGEYIRFQISDDTYVIITNVIFNFEVPNMRYCLYGWFAATDIYYDILNLGRDFFLENLDLWGMHNGAILDKACHLQKN